MEIRGLFQSLSIKCCQLQPEKAKLVRGSFSSRSEPTPKRGSCLFMTENGKKCIDYFVLRQQFNYVSWPAATNLTVFTYVQDFF